LGHFICVTGVSGSGKSTLVDNTLYHALAKALNPAHREKPGKHKEITGWQGEIDKVMLIDQSPIGRTPRSNPATYSQAFGYIREIFSQTPEARIRGLNPGKFSFNVKGGRCEVCQGAGEVKIEMQFLPDLYVQCDVCNGNRYNSETLEIEYKGQNIKQVLDLSVSQAYEFFHNIPPLSERLKNLIDVGLGYIKLGQSAMTLSGGEAQRLKLSRELAKKQTGNCFYILDEPTTGLHFEDLNKLLKVLKKLVSSGNTVLVIEHNLDVIKNADWVIDLGPEGGDEGGKVVAFGTPEDIVKKNTITGKFLKKELEK
jgi:excinuclease ABC subunit A